MDSFCSHAYEAMHGNDQMSLLLVGNNTPIWNRYSNGANTPNTYSACSIIVTLTEDIKCMPILDNPLCCVNVIYIIILSMLTLPLKKTIVCETSP